MREALSALLEQREQWPELLDCMEGAVRDAAPDARAGLLKRAADIAWEHVSPEAAIPWLERLRRAQPDDPSAVARIAVAHRRAGRLEAQLRALEEQAGLVADPEQRKALQLERAALLETERCAPGRALAVLKAVLEALPGDRELLEHVERLQRQLGLDAQRAVTLEALLAGAGPEEIELHRQLAELCDSCLGDSERAVRHWEIALARVPEGSSARIEILHALAESHRRAARLEAWAQCTEQELAALDPVPVFDDRRRELRRELALAYEARLAMPDAALRHVRALLDAGDDELLGTEMRDRLEHTCLKLLRCAEDPTELEARLSRFLERNPDCAEHWLELARLREERLHSAANALAAYRRTLELDADCLPALRGVRRTAERLGRWNDVAEALERELAHPDLESAANRSALLRRLGDVCWHRLQSTTRASRFYAAALEENAADFASLRALERLLEAMEDWRGALDLYESEIEVLGDGDPYRRRELWLHVATLARDRTDELERARRAFSRAAELQPWAPRDCWNSPSCTIGQQTVRHSPTRSPSGAMRRTPEPPVRTTCAWRSAWKRSVGPKKPWRASRAV